MSNIIGQQVKLIFIILVVGFLFLLLVKQSDDFKNFENFTTDFTNGKHLVYFHWNQCGHCKTFTPIWDDFESKHSDKSIKLTKIEHSSAESAGLLKKYNVEGYPHVILIKDGVECPGRLESRTDSGLQQLMKSQCN